jgi:hypothetical protein
MPNDVSDKLAEAVAATARVTPPRVLKTKADAPVPKKLLLDAARGDVIVDVPASHAPLPTPEFSRVNASEEATSALLDAAAEYARDLRRKARSGQMNTKDGNLLAKLAAATAKLAAEQREQETEMHLALQSDADIVKLVLDSVQALGPRGRAILIEVAAQLGLTLVD